MQEDNLRPKTLAAKILEDLPHPKDGPTQEYWDDMRTRTGPLGLPRRVNESLKTIQHAAEQFHAGRLSSSGAARKFSQALPDLGIMTFYMDLTASDLPGQVRTALDPFLQDRDNMDKLHDLIEACRDKRRHPSVHLGPYFDLMDRTMQFIEFAKRKPAILQYQKTHEQTPAGTKLVQDHVKEIMEFVKTNESELLEFAGHLNSQELHEMQGKYKERIERINETCEFWLEGKIDDATFDRALNETLQVTGRLLAIAVAQAPLPKTLEDKVSVCVKEPRNLRALGDMLAAYSKTPRKELRMEWEPLGELVKKLQEDRGQAHMASNSVQI